MTTFQQTALLLTFIWVVIVVVRFRRSVIVLLGGLIWVSLYTVVASAYGAVTPEELGFVVPHSWTRTTGLALVWLGLMIAYSPVADWLAGRWIPEPPNLEAFGALRESTAKLIAGIVVAWVLGGLLEEVVVRGVVLQSVESLLAPWLNELIAAGAAVCVAAIGAGLLHFYQGPRAVVIITQLSVLFGVLFVISGYDLWAVILCHGLYDTVAFIRFAYKRPAGT
jgi:membrane protease YdiL (CAAX protease family)